VDNGSTDMQSISDIDFYLRNIFPSNYQKLNEGEQINRVSLATLLVSNNNSGYARGNNKGLSLFYTDMEITEVMILNNDIIFIEDIIPLLQKYSNESDTAIVSPLLLKKDGVTIDYGCARKNVSVKELFIIYLFFYFDPLRYKQKYARARLILFNNINLLEEDRVHIELPSGSCMLMKKSLCQLISGFDPNTFLYYEENILYKKIEKLNLNNYIIPRINCIHVGALTTSKEKGYYILKAGVDSAQYYINEYENPVKFVKYMFSLVKKIFLLEAWVQKNIYKYISKQ
jgi:GT2 family glycosyltransferase